MLVIKTGMADEARLARQYSRIDSLVLTGVQNLSDLQKIIPPGASAIISFGLCGALSPEAQIGQIFLGDTLIGPEGETYTADVPWRKRLFAKTRAYERPWYSSGLFNTANTPDQRAALFKKTGAWIIDDESLFVAQVAKARGIPFQIMRSVSDGVNDVIPPAAAGALNQDGTSNILNVLASVLGNPFQIPGLISLAQKYYKSLDELCTAAISVGPSFQAEVQ